jgi:hypothetical protein
MPLLLLLLHPDADDRSSATTAVAGATDSASPGCSLETLLAAGTVTAAAVLVIILIIVIIIRLIHSFIHSLLIPFYLI